MGNSGSSDDEHSSDDNEEPTLVCNHADDRYKLKPIKGESEMKRGDHIAALRNMGSVDLYYHHGIYVGGEKPLIGFGGFDWEGTTQAGFGTDMHSATVEQFRFGDDELFRVVWPKGVAKKSERVAVVAEAFLVAYEKKPAVFGRYSLATNNCEHFASYCKTGLRVSQQVEDLHEDILEFFNMDTDEEECCKLQPAQLADKFVARREAATSM